MTISTFLGLRQGTERPQDTSRPTRPLACPHAQNDLRPAENTAPRPERAPRHAPRLSSRTNALVCVSPPTTPAAGADEDLPWWSLSVLAPCEVDPRPLAYDTLSPTLDSPAPSPRHRPEDLFGGRGTYQLDPRVVFGLVQWFHKGPPIRDAFANAENHQFPNFWTPHDNAMSKDWSAAGFLWVNPPWHYLPGILRKLRKDCAQAIVIVPDMDWQTILAIKALAVQTICLGPGMMFRRRPHLPFLPLPSWTVSACLFWPQATTWLKNLVTCGDVESNPGPMTFGEFTRTSFDDFLALAPPRWIWPAPR